jgi:hypothetical protein
MKNQYFSQNGVGGVRPLGSDHACTLICELLVGLIPSNAKIMEFVYNTTDNTGPDSHLKWLITYIDSEANEN